MNTWGHPEQRVLSQSVFDAIISPAPIRTPPLQHCLTSLHLQVFEAAVRIMPEGVEQWVWLNDFIGFGVGDMNPALAVNFIDLMAR